MKIAIINYSSSGLFHYACSLVNSLAKLNNIQEILFITSNKNDLSLIDNNQKIKVLAQKTPHKLISFLLWCINPNEQFLFRKRLKQFQPDVIHILDVYPVYLLHHFLLKKYHIVFTQHDPTVHTGDSYSLIIKFIHFYLQKISKKVIVHGETLKRDLKKQSTIPNHKIATVPFGDLSLLLRYPPHGNKIPHSILFFGRISHYKGLDVLLNSLILLQKENINFSLTIAGHGNLNDYYKKVKNIKNINIINKKIPDKDVSTFFHQHEMIVLPYREATQSGVIALALPAKIPIVATRVGAFPEVLINNYNSLLVPPNNPHQLSLAIKKLLGNKALREKLIVGEKETIKNRINWNISARKYYDIYNPPQ
jgi:glycosyltransferase involved in cell wall biosynthesis